MRYYVAYGSNLNTEQMRWRCPGAKLVGTANLIGYELVFKGSKTGSYLTIEENPESLVPVAVWSVTKRDEAALDRYEGYPTFYYKKDLLVNVGTQTMQAFVYIMNEDRPYGIPSSHYVDVCREGYKTFGFDEYHLHRAVWLSRERMHGKEKVS